MSDESASQSPEPQESHTRPSRSPVEKLVWGLIAVVILGLGLELYAKNSYEKTMAALDEVLNGSNASPQRLSDIRQRISGLTRFGERVPSPGSSAQQEIQVSWLCPSNGYGFTLVLESADEDPVVAWYKLDDGNWARDPYAPGIEDIPTQYGDEDIPSASEMAGGMADGGDDHSHGPGSGREGRSGHGGEAEDGHGPGQEDAGTGGEGDGDSPDGENDRPQRPASDSTDADQNAETGPTSPSPASDGPPTDDE